MVPFLSDELCVQAGQTVPMSSVLLSDPTKSYFKLSLWREAAAWVERISMGDIIYFRGKQRTMNNRSHCSEVGILYRCQAEGVEE